MLALEDDVMLITGQPEKIKKLPAPRTVVTEQLIVEAGGLELVEFALPGVKS